MIKRIEHWALNRVYPTFDDRESLTAIELIGKNTTKINEIIDTVNAFIDEVNKEIDEFIATSNANYETFKVAMEQKFQDFIDIIDLKIKSQDEHIDEELARIKEEALKYIDSSIGNIGERLSALENTEYSLVHDDTTESLTLVKTVNGEVIS